MKRAGMPDHANNEIATSGGQGFGLRANNPQPAGKWIKRFEEWLAESGFLNSREQIVFSRR